MAKRQPILTGSKSTKGASRDVGRPLDARTAKLSHKRGSLRWQFATGFRQHTGDMTPDQIATKLGYKSDMVRKMLRGDRLPDIEEWPKIAAKLGLNSWTELFVAG